MALFFEEHSDLVMPVTTGADIDKAKRIGKIGIILGTQNTSALEDELSLVSVFNNLGIKIMQLTNNNQNLIGSSYYEANDPGLSRYGELVVKEMNRVGMLIDLSHVGEKTSIDTIKLSQRPVAITHANPDWIYPSNRNKSREVLTALRENGGVLGICAYPHLIGGKETTLEEIEAGIIKINMTTTGTFFQVPFGGYKKSSTGTYKELGSEALEFYCQYQKRYIKS